MQLDASERQRNYFISIVPTERIPYIWNDVAPILERAVKTTPNTFDIDSLLDVLLHNQQQLWIVFDENNTIHASFTTYIVLYPLCKILGVPFVAGKNMREWIDQALSILETYAKENGCGGIEGYGRRGWTRQLGSHGWKPEYIVYQKML